jgi:hypothetical protein
MRTLIWTAKNKFFAIDVGHIREVLPRGFGATFARWS